MEEKDTIWRRLVEFQIRQRIAILLLIAAGTVFFLYHLSQHLRIATDFFDLYPPKHAYIELYKQYRKMFGSANVLTIILEVKEGDIYTVETLNKLYNITHRILKVKGVNPMQVISLTHPKMKDVRVGVAGVMVRPLMWPRLPQTDEELVRLKKAVYTNEGIRGVYITPDDKATLLHAGFWEEGVDLKNLFLEVKKIQEQEEDENHSIYVTGYPVLYAWIAHYGFQLSMVFLATGLVMLALLILYFRTFLGAAVPMISGLLSAVWGLGFAAALGNNIDPLILVVPMLLSARALSHSVQSMERYHEEYVRLGDKGEAVLRTYSHLYKPAVLSIVTDGLGVLTIAVCTIPIMQKLAFFSSFWIISIYVSVVLLNPILVYLLPAPKEKKLGSELKDLDVEQIQEIRQITARPGDRLYLEICKGLFHLSQSWRKWVMVGLMVFLIIGGGIYARQLKVGDTSAGKSILYPDHPYNVAADKLNRDFIGASQLIVIAEGKEEGAFRDPDSLRALEDLQLYAQGIPHVGGTVSITNIIKRVFRMFHEGDPKWEMLPEEPSHLAQTLFLFGGSMAPGEMDRFISVPDYSNATVTLFFRSYNNQIIKDAIASVKKFAEDNVYEKVNFRLAGGIVGILAAVNEEVEWSYWVNLGLIFSVTFLLCAVTFRSILSAVVLIVPLVISQILSEGFMLLKGIDLNINSLPVAAVGVGVGVDYGIYVLSRLSEEYTRHDSYEDAAYVAITTTGKAVLFTATTLVAGVIFWIFSSMKFQAEMGLLLAFLMVFNMLGSLVLLPSLVSVIGQDRVLLKYRA
jgi:predicted RND superfamily exporter protein